MELETEIVSLPDATTSIGPSLFTVAHDMSLYYIIARYTEKLTKGESMVSRTMGGAEG